MYYQRVLASRDKESVSNEIQTTEPKPEYEKIIKDPYVMEFLQIQPDTHVYEGELEQALIDHLQHCKCGMSWSKDEGFFKHTPDMVFTPERRKVMKETKQVPIIRYKTDE